MFSSMDSVHFLLDLFPNISWHVLPFVRFPFMFSKQLSLLFRDILTLVCIDPPQPERLIIPGFILGGLAAIVVTLIDKAPSAEVEAIFEKATDNSIDD